MLENIGIEDIPDRYNDILDMVGLDGFIGLVQLYGGSIVYFPTVASLNKNYRNRVIRNDFRGDFNELAKKYGLSRNQIYNIIMDNQCINK